jgi:hypothetical protein
MEDLNARTKAKTYFLILYWAPVFKKTPWLF